MLRGRPLANRCCMCCCDRESVDHFLLHCPVTHTLYFMDFYASGLWYILGHARIGGENVLVGISGLGSIIRTFEI